MSNVIKFEINGTTNADQVTGRVKSSVSTLEKNFQAVAGKFKDFGKDLFMSFAAPMVIVNTLVSMISSAMEKAKQDAKDGVDLIAKGETIYATAEEKKTAAFFKAKAEREKEMALVEKGKEELGRTFSLTPEGREAFREFMDMGNNRLLAQMGMGGVVSYEGVYKNKDFQNFMVKKFIETPEGKAYKPIFDDKTSDKFKSPDGLNAVVGIGANPTLDAMTQQLEEQRKQTALLEQIAQGSPAKDFTKTENK